MGSVWAAADLSAGDAPVALKILHPSLALRADARQRLLREAEAANLIRHPGVIAAREVLEVDGRSVLVMDLLAGETMRSLLDRDGQLEFSRAARILAEVASVLCAAHAAGVVHRDLKPENVFLASSCGPREAVKVLDFGVAKLLFAAPSDAAQALTKLGTLLGTVAYMAPEQVTGASSVDASADVWALGAVLYEALSGCRPFEGETQNEMIRRLLTDAVTPIGVLTPDLPEELQSLLGKMLSRAPDRRTAIAEVEAILARYACP
jgi:eukaryotic-like serine/threonine-protein kinase